MYCNPISPWPARQRISVVLNHRALWMHESLFMEELRKKVVEAVGGRMNRSEAAYLLEVGLPQTLR